MEAGADVTTICQEAGISRKTGYQWAEKYDNAYQEEASRLRQENEQLKAAQEAIQKEHARLCFENEGRKIAWEIHGVDKFLASKKNSIVKAIKRPKQ